MRSPESSAGEAALFTSDSLGSGELAAHHTDDTHHHVDPASLPDRLVKAGFERVEVRTNPYGWAVVAVKTRATTLTP